MSDERPDPTAANPSPAPGSPPDASPADPGLTDPSPTDAGLTDPDLIDPDGAGADAGALQVPDLGGLVGGLLGGGSGGLGDLLAQAQQAMSASRAASDQEVEGSAGGGVVRVRMTAGGEPRHVTIDPAAVDPDDVEGLEDLVLAALRDAHAAAARLHEQALGGFDPSGMLGGLLGGPDDDDE